MAEAPTLGVTAEIRAEMARQGVKQKELARAVGLSDNALWRRLRGDTDMTVSELQAIADVLGVPITKFFPDVDARAA